MFDAKITGKMDISKIIRPIQLLAIFIIVIDITFLVAGFYFSTAQMILAYLCVFSAIGFTAYVLYLFKSILFKFPWAFYHPSDFEPGVYEKFVKHLLGYQDDIQSANEEMEVTSSTKVGTIEPTKEERGSTEQTLKSIEETSDFRIYYENAMAFERIVGNYLRELNLSIFTPSAKNISPDFIVTNKDGQSVPIEVKYYRKGKPNNEMIKKVVNQMITFMESYNSEESIIIFSSDVGNSTKTLIKTLSQSYSIHVVGGHNKEDLKAQLKEILA